MALGVLPALLFAVYVVSLALELECPDVVPTASYGNEALVGEGLQEEMQQGKRQRLYITSKVWNDAHRPDAVRCGVATSFLLMLTCFCLC